MDREQIVKALTMFVEDMPATLKLGVTGTALFRVLNDTIALIRELTEENERLRAELEQRPPKLIIAKLPKKESKNV